MSEYLWLPDNGDGTYRNPVIFSDYSDPDCICVDGVYYLTASTFNYVPGLPILTSTDLVNWTLRTYAIKNIPVERFNAPCHAHGVWAPAIRWHEGKFYIYYGMPDEGIYMVRTDDPVGEWEEPVLVLPGKGLIDPCPFWDDDGRAYVIHGYAKSRIGFKSWLGIFSMSADGTHAIGDDKLLFDGVEKHPTIEGPKVHKRDGWYYIFAPAGGVATGWQVVMRSKNLYGPYEDRVVLKQGSSETNGPHQGAWVETPEGESWFMHFQSRGLYGRITHLQPMSWDEEGWPFIGQVDPDPVDPASIQTGEDAKDAAMVANAVECGIPVDTWQKPRSSVKCECTGEIGTDYFDDELGLQWQFMGNWRPDFYDCGDGYLRLYARQLPNGGTKLWECPQTCTQKIASPAFTATTSVDVSDLKVGEQAGVGLVGGQYAYAAIRRLEDGLHLVYVTSVGKDHAETVHEDVKLTEEKLSFRMTLLPTGYAEAVTTFEYAVGGVYHSIGEPFAPARHTWVGARLALFAMPMNGQADQGGCAVFMPFQVEPVETLL